MPKIVIETAEDSPVVAFPAQPGVTLSGPVTTTGVICASDRPLLLWVHTLQPGARVAFDTSPVGHVLYVLQGEVEVDGNTLPTGQAIVVEHQGKAAIRPQGQGATLAHFQERFDPACPPAKAGGHVHGREHPGAYTTTDAKGKVRTSFADSTCPTCELWLHGASMPADAVYAPHYHTEPEIILVTEGEMIVGRRTLTPLTALAIDAHTHYKFDTGPQGMSFINFRSKEPHLVQKQPDGSYLSYNEREFAKALGKLPGTKVPMPTASAA